MFRLLFVVLHLQMSVEDDVTVATEVSIQIVIQSEAWSFHGLHGLVVQFYLPLGMLGGAQGVQPVLASSLLCPLCQD